jgi:predicted HicB family RNase H-like nuclease
MPRLTTTKDRKTDLVGARVTGDEYDRIQREARRRGVSVSDWVRSLIEQELQRVTASRRKQR